MITYEHTIAKDVIAELPVEQFPGRIIVLTTEKEANKAVDYLLKFPVVGFDTETRPSFKKGLIKSLCCKSRPMTLVSCSASITWVSRLP